MRSRFHLPVSAALLLVAAAALLAGCTARQSQEQYEGRLEAALAVRSEVSAQLDEQSISGSGAYRAASQDVLEALDELDADPPPRNLQGAHDSMVSGLEGLAGLLDDLGACEAAGEPSTPERRACRQAIGQEVYDEIRNDFDQANTIYRAEGLALPGLGREAGTEDTLGEDPEGGDEL